MPPDSDNANAAVGPELLARLVDAHAATLVLYARQLCDVPEDAVQEALIELARQPTAPRQIVAWLYRVVRNKALSAARASQRRRRHELSAAEHRRAWFGESPSGRIEAEEATAALEQLPSEEREIVVAHLWGGLTFVQIGELVGVSDSTAHRRYQSALSQLHEQLQSTSGESCPPPDKTPR